MALLRRGCFSDLSGVDGDLLQPHDADAADAGRLSRARRVPLARERFPSWPEGRLVTHAYDLLEMTRKGQDVGAMISRSQREATTVLNSLFGFFVMSPLRTRRTRRTTLIVTWSEATTTVKAARR